MENWRNWLSGGPTYGYDGLYSICRAERPWAQTGGVRRERHIHTTPQAEIDACLSCTRPEGSCSHCSGPVAGKLAQKLVLVRRLWEEGLSDEEIAARVGIKTSTVRAKLNRLRLPPNVASDPCQRCKSKQICQSFGGTCGEKARWERAPVAEI